MLAELMIPTMNAALVTGVAVVLPSALQASRPRWWGAAGVVPLFLGRDGARGFVGGEPVLALGAGVDRA